MLPQHAADTLVCTEIPVRVGQRPRLALGADCPQGLLSCQQCSVSRTEAHPPAPKKRCFTLSSRRTGYTPQFSTSVVTISGLPCSATLHTGAAFL